MSIQSRLRTIEKAAQERLRRVVFAAQWYCLEPPELRDKFRCPEFDGIPDTWSVIGGPPELYHWTLEGLKAEAERRGVELQLVRFYDATRGQYDKWMSDAQNDEGFDHAK